MIWRRRAAARTRAGRAGVRNDPLRADLYLQPQPGLARRHRHAHRKAADASRRAGRSRCGRARPGSRIEHLRTRLDKTVLSFAHHAATIPAARASVEASPRPAPVPLLPRLPTRDGTDFIFTPPAAAATPRAGAIGVRSRRPAMAARPQARIRGQAAASPLAPRPAAALVWRQKSARGETAPPSAALTYASPSRPTELVWRRPAPVEPGSETACDARAASRAARRRRPAAWRGETRAGASAPAAPTALQPVEMGRLVDEVVRRLDRIGRDERMRRGSEPWPVCRSSKP